MARWQVELTGHSFDLEELPRLFTAPELRVVEDDGRYFLEAKQFETLTEGQAVDAAARELLPRIIGIAKLSDRSFRSVETGGIRERDTEGKTRHHLVIHASTMQIRSKVGALVVKAGEESVPPPPGSLVSDGWMRATSSDAHAARALALWGGPHDPTNLWKVWELVRGHSGLTIDADLRRRFRPALNDRAIAGENARHEVPLTRYPVQPDTMTMAEAEWFLGDLLTQWLSRQS
jgi:hypothetical protein